MEASKATRARIILEAARLTTSSEFDALDQLLSSNLLRIEHVLRILLTFLPSGTEPELYATLLKTIYKNAQRPPKPLDYAISQDFSDVEACSRVRQLRLLPLQYSEYNVQDTDALTLFLIHLAYKIESETGSLKLVAQLLESFVEHSGALRTWMVSILLPLLRAEYEFGSTSNPSLADFGHWSIETSISALFYDLSRHSRHEETRGFGPALRELVAPYMYGDGARKRRKLNHDGLDRSLPSASGDSPVSRMQDGWAYVNEQLVDLGMKDLPSAVDTFTQWQGRSDVDYGTWGKDVARKTGSQIETDPSYIQAGLAIVYGTEEADLEALDGSHRILRSAADMLCLDLLEDFRQFDLSSAALSLDFAASPSDILRDSLLNERNPLTHPWNDTIRFANLLLASAYKLASLGNLKSARDVARLCLFTSEEGQFLELRSTVQKLQGRKMDTQFWKTVSSQIFWLSTWNVDHAKKGKVERGPFGKIQPTTIEKQILRAMLDGSCYNAVIDVYCKSSEHSLTHETIEDVIFDTVYDSYDSASNGNKTRGKMRNVSEMLSSFQRFFPKSRRFEQAKALLAATHSMSFYSLSVQHGIPLQPVNIRASKDPIGLIGRILDQNPRSYTHLDDMLEIGQNLVKGSIVQVEGDQVDQQLEVRRRISRMAVEAALAEDDFDTAYSYIVNRLSMSQSTGTLDDESPTAHDDISWRAALAAGRHPFGSSDSTSSRRLEQRMELLSQALLLAPPPALTEVLGVWQHCEEQMANLLAQEASEEQDWDHRADQNVPGSFGTLSAPAQPKSRDAVRGMLEEEAPMGLFEVARGAASALSKNAFPLRNATKGETPRAFGHEEEELDEAESIDASTRIRKRDMVSNMVTGGLVSGIGWVIGAPPPKNG